MALGRERSGYCSVSRAGEELAGAESGPDCLHEVEQDQRSAKTSEDIAEDNAALLWAFPGAKSWRVVASVDTREHTALAEAVKRVEGRGEREP